KGSAEFVASRSADDDHECGLFLGGRLREREGDTRQKEEERQSAPNFTIHQPISTTPCQRGKLNLNPAGRSSGAALLPHKCGSEEFCSGVAVPAANAGVSPAKINAGVWPAAAGETPAPPATACPKTPFWLTLSETLS